MTKDRKRYHTISINFIRENITPATFSDFDWSLSPGSSAENGPVYVCIYSGGQIMKLTRMTCMQYMSLQTPKFLTGFLYILAHMELFLGNLLADICDISNIIYVAAANYKCDICGDIYGQHRALTFDICLYLPLNSLRPSDVYMRR